LVLQAVGVGAAFAFRVAVGRTLGTDGAGLFFLAQTVLLIGGNVGTMGLEAAAVRFTATGIAAGDHRAVAGAYRLAMRYAGLTATVLTVALILGAEPLAVNVFHDPRLTEPLRWLALGVLPLAFVRLHGEFLKGRRRVAWALLVNGVTLPVVAMAVTVALAPRLGLPGTVAGYLSATIAAMGVGVALWRRGTAELRSVRPEFSSTLLLSSAMPILVVTVAQLIGQHSGTFVLGAMAGMDDVGIFAVALRTAMMISLVLLAVNSVAAPRFAALHAAGDRGRLERFARTATLAMLAIATPVLALLIFAPSWVLGLFGDGFRAGAAALMVLALGQFFNVATGSVGWLLKMSGHERSLRNVVVTAHVISFGLCCVLVPHYGLVGAALATAAGVVLQNSAATVLVWRHLGIVVLPLPLPRRCGDD
jgi:O-antigen/teichoic acid export membrane protein